MPSIVTVLPVVVVPIAPATDSVATTFTVEAESNDGQTPGAITLRVNLWASKRRMDAMQRLAAPE